MSLELIVFLVTSAIIIGSAIAVMFTRNIVHCIFYLLLALIGIAGIYAMLNAQFLAAVQVFIYAGAVTVLMLFVIMLTMTQKDSATIEVKQSPLAMVIAVFFWIAMSVSLSMVKWGKVVKVNNPGKTIDLAEALFTKLVLPFEIASVILLAAIIGALYLAQEQK